MLTSEIMELKEIVQKSKEQLTELLGDRIYQGKVLLEEVEPQEGGSWKITLGFFEDNIAKTNFMSPVSILQGDVTKTYKVLYVSADGKVEKVKNYA